MLAGDNRPQIPPIYPVSKTTPEFLRQQGYFTRPDKIFAAPLRGSEHDFCYSTPRLRASSPGDHSIGSEVPGVPLHESRLAAYGGKGPWCGIVSAKVSSLRAVQMLYIAYQSRILASQKWVYSNEA